MDIQFSVNEFDHDGDLSEEGIYLHFGKTRIKVADNIKEYSEFVAKLDNMKDEISEVYG